MSEPPAWAQQLFAPLMASVQRLQEQQQHLQEQFQALSLSSTVALLPDAPSPDALQGLLNHPYLSDADRLYARLLMRFLPAAMADEDNIARLRRPL